MQLDLPKDLTALTPAEANTYIDRIAAAMAELGDLLQRLRTIATSEAAVEQQHAAETAARGVEVADGAPWQDRGHLGYGTGITVTHNDATWTSRVPYNVWEPGADGGHAWTRQAPDNGAWAEGVAYVVGDEVTHDGASWRCTLAHTSHGGWAPSAATPTVWQPM